MSEDRPDRYTCLALDGARLAGFTCVFGNEHTLWGSYVDNLHVASDYQRRGVGRSLMHRAAQWLGEHYPRSGVYLWVMEANGRARRFYEHLGARNVGTTLKADPGGGCAPNCRYAWDDPETLLGGAGH